MKRVLLGVPVHQDADVFQEYLDSLDRLVIPDGYELQRCFYLHNSRDLAPLLSEKDMILYNDNPMDYKTDGKTHQWGEVSLREVAKMKNEMIQIALRGGYDYYLLVDSDLILHANTLKNLIERDKEIIAGVFWTEWITGSGTLGPNCWDYDNYEITNMNRYIVPGCHETGGTGALILIKREVLEKGINYTPIYNVAMTIYEDRAFCVRAAVHGYQLYVDTTLPARHLYRRGDYEKYMKKKGGEGHKNKS